MKRYPLSNLPFWLPPTFDLTEETASQEARAVVRTNPIGHAPPWRIMQIGVTERASQLEIGSWDRGSKEEEEDEEEIENFNACVRPAVEKKNPLYSVLG